MPLDTNCKHTDSMHPLEHVGPRMQAMYLFFPPAPSKAKHHTQSLVRNCILWGQALRARQARTRSAPVAGLFLK